MSKADLIVGIQLGDEGKGKMVDMLLKITIWFVEVKVDTMQVIRFGLMV